MRYFFCIAVLIFCWASQAGIARAYSAELFAESQSTYTFSKTKQNLISRFRLVHHTTNGEPTSLDKMIGQMLMLGFSGTKPSDKSVQAARQLLAKGKIGGLIFMGANLQDRKQVHKLVTYMKSAAPLDRPAFIAIDQEGGKVQRLRAAHGFTDMPQAVELAKTYGADQGQKFVNGILDKLAQDLRAVERQAGRAPSHEPK